MGDTCINILAIASCCIEGWQCLAGKTDHPNILTFSLYLFAIYNYLLKCTLLGPHKKKNNNYKWNNHWEMISEQCKCLFLPYNFLFHWRIILKSLRCDTCWDLYQTHAFLNLIYRPGHLPSTAVPHHNDVFFTHFSFTQKCAAYCDLDGTGPYCDLTIINLINVQPYCLLQWLLLLSITIMITHKLWLQSTLQREREDEYNLGISIHCKGIDLYQSWSCCA